MGASDIKSDVIENVKSRDADSLVRAIDQAIESGSWSGTQEIWTYIKSRRRQLRKDLNENEQRDLERFIEAKRAEGIFILSRGALESYLPPGHGSKELDKLIRLIGQPDFWDQLPNPGKQELESIAAALLQTA